MRRRETRARAPSSPQPSEQMGMLLKTVAAVHPEADLQLIERAYTVAAHSHRGQLRKSGDPYITHPIAVATIVVELGISPELVCAALLHDTIEDTPYTLVQLREEFGEAIATLVNGASTLDESQLDQAVAAVELNTDPVSICQSHEVGALVLKLADRLHNMRTMHFLPPDTQKSKSRQTLLVHAPVAQLLGMDTISRELHERASAILTRELSGERRSRTVSERMLVASVMILPAATRARWLAEWTGELSALPTRQARARFAVQMLRGMPRLALALRRPATPDTPVPATTRGDGVAGALAISGVLLAALTRWELAAWAASAMLLGGLVLLAAVLFARSDGPAHRLRELIRAWRDPAPRTRSNRRRHPRSRP
ncbi:MAG: HD domain-containing protein [Pseudonocardiaceae bacterium]